jgi:hypothetical protein
VIKHKDGRRNRDQIQAYLPLPEPASQEPAIGEVLALLAGAAARLQLAGTGPAWSHCRPACGGSCAATGTNAAAAREALAEPGGSVLWEQVRPRLVPAFVGPSGGGTLDQVRLVPGRP